MNFDLLVTPGALLSGLEFIAAAWVLCASVWRINLLKWGESQCLQVVAYLILAGWALTVLVGLREFGFLGIVGVALLFFGGRKRWLKKAPPDTARSTP